MKWNIYFYIAFGVYLLTIIMIIVIQPTNNDGLTDTYDNWDCLNKCYEIMNWTDGSHRAYADCSDLCVAGEIDYQK